MEFNSGFKGLINRHILPSYFIL